MTSRRSLSTEVTMRAQVSFAGERCADFITARVPFEFPELFRRGANARMRRQLVQQVRPVLLDERA